MNMKKLFLGLTAALLIACGGESTAPQIGEVMFKVDGLTCTGTSSIQFFIDGSLVGQQTLSAGGQSSSAFTVDAGPHTVGARDAVSGGFVWPTSNITVPSNTSYTTTLTC